MHDETARIYAADETTAEEWSADVGDLMVALAKAQAEMSNPETDQPNNFGKRYASLAAVRNAVVPVLAKHGIATTQHPTPFCEGYAGCVTTIWHGKQYLKSTMVARVIRFSKGGGIISAENLTHIDYSAVFSYLRRGGLKGLACVADEADEDEERHSTKDGHIEFYEERRWRPAPPLMHHPDETTPEMLAEERRHALLNEIATLYKQTIVPLKHAGMHKAIFSSCFALDKPELIKEQSLETFERGLPLYRRLTAALGTWDRKATPSPDAWIGAQERRFAEEHDAATDAFRAPEPPHDEETGEIMGTLDDMPAEWLTRQEAEERREREQAQLQGKTTA